MMATSMVLTTMLLFSYVHAENTALAKQKFTIRKVILSIEPSTDVAWGANVTLRCQAVLDKPVALSLEFTIYKGNNVACSQTSSSSMDLLCPLTKVKQVNTGRYRCVVKFEDQQEHSEVKKLTVKDVPLPVLHLNPDVATEGEEITLTCTAHEQPSEFHFYKDSNEIKMMDSNSTQAVLKHRITRSGMHKFHCSYEVLVDRKQYESGNSNTVTVSVKELVIKPVLEITGPQKIYEGDQLFLTCSINGSLPSTNDVNLLLKQGTKFLSEGYPKVSNSSVVLEEGPADFRCELDLKRVVKTTSKIIPVAELFSAPTLTMSTDELFQMEEMMLTCRSGRYASERLNSSQLMYSLDPPQEFLYSKSIGVFNGKAPKFGFNVSCVAKYKGITKYSQVLTLHPKVPVSIPEISVVGHAILGRPVKILCRSRTGSLPINYTLIEDYNTVSTITVSLATEEAIFTVTSAGNLKSYMCEASNRNSNKNPQLSRRLNALVTVPLSKPTLTIIPDLAEISEGDHLHFICGVSGTPPVTFKWYRSDEDIPLSAITSYTNNTDFQVPFLYRNYSGRYHCEAVNNANNVVHSDFVDIHVRLALWKKALIGGVCALAMSVLLVGLVLYFKSRRVKRTEISIWTQRPPENEFFSETVDNEESSMVTTEPDVEYTEVVHAQPADPNRVLRRQGTDTVYSELQNSPHGMDDHDSYGPVEYNVFNGEQEEITHCLSEVNPDQDLPSSSVG